MLNDMVGSLCMEKKQKYVKGRLLLGKMNVKLFNKNSWYSGGTQNGYLQNSQTSFYSVKLLVQNMVEP